MKIILALVFVFSSIVSTAYAQNIACGIQPIPPIGCNSNSAHCVCNAQGQCHWVFDC